MKLLHRSAFCREYYKYPFPHCWPKVSQGSAKTLPHGRYIRHIKGMCRGTVASGFRVLGFWGSEYEVQKGPFKARLMRICQGDMQGYRAWGSLGFRASGIQGFEV